MWGCWGARGQLRSMHSNCECVVRGSYHPSCSLSPPSRSSRLMLTTVRKAKGKSQHSTFFFGSVIFVSLHRRTEMLLIVSVWMFCSSVSYLQPFSCNQCIQLNKLILVIFFNQNEIFPLFSVQLYNLKKQHDYMFKTSFSLTVSVSWFEHLINIKLIFGQPSSTNSKKSSKSSNHLKYKDTCVSSLIHLLVNNQKPISKYF